MQIKILCTSFIECIWTEYRYGCISENNPDWSEWLCASLVWYSGDWNEDDNCIEDHYQPGGQDDLTVPDEVGDVLDGLQVVRLLGVCEGLLLQSLGVVS